MGSLFLGLYIYACESQEWLCGSEPPVGCRHCSARDGYHSARHSTQRTIGPLAYTPSTHVARRGWRYLSISRDHCDKQSWFQYIVDTWARKSKPATRILLDHVHSTLFNVKLGENNSKFKPYLYSCLSRLCCIRIQRFTVDNSHHM